MAEALSVAALPGLLEPQLKEDADDHVASVQETIGKRFGFFVDGDVLLPLE